MIRLAFPERFSRLHGMDVERVKYVIWAADMDRAVKFYQEALGGELLKQSDIIKRGCSSGRYHRYSRRRGGERDMDRTQLPGRAMS